MKSNPEHKQAILLLLALAQLLIIVDSSIINVALPAIKAGLHFSEASLQWVVTAYILTFGGFLMLGGRLSDLFGRRRMLVYGIGAFSIISLLLGLAPSGPVLIALRAVQGLAAALMAPASLSILLTTFAEGPERNKALSIWSIVGSGGGAVGVFLGGLLTQYLGWRWCFFVNVPIGLFAVLGILKYVPAHLKEEAERHLDLRGAVLITAGLMILVYGLSRAPQLGWTAVGTLVPVLASVLILATFIFNESRAGHPLVPLSIFRLRNVTGGNIVMLPVVAGALGLFYFASLFIQNVMHYSPLISGACFLPIPIIIGLVSTKAPQLIDRFGFKRLMVAGLSCIVVGMFVLSTLSEHSSYFVHMLPAFVLMGIGFGLSFVAITIAATTGVPDDESGLASGLINTSQQIGGALGIAILAVISSARIRSDVAGGSSVLVASLHGYQQAFLVAACLILAALILGIIIIREPKTGE